MILSALLLLSGQSPLPDSIPNGGFEADAERATGWRFALGRGYRGGVDQGTAFEGRQSAFIGYFARNGADRGGVQPAVYTRIDARRYRGKTIRISGAVRLPAAGSGRLVLSADAPRQQALSAAFSGDQWQRVAVDLTVPARARTIDIRFEVTRGNDLNVDDVRIEPAPR